MIVSLADVGNAALLLALVLSLYAAAAGFIGARRGRANLVHSAKSTTLVVFGLLCLAVVLLEYFLVTHGFQVAYVADNTNRAQPVLYNLAALWGGQEGSLLFWGRVLAMFAVIVLIQNRRQHPELIPYVLTGMLVTKAFFLVLMVFVTSPFKLLG